MAAVYRNCRACGEKLLSAEHVRFGKVVTEADEKASGVSSHYEGAQVHSWIHTPCPKCNEPRPMVRKWRGWLVIAVFALLFGLGIWMEFG